MRASPRKHNARSGSRPLRRSDSFFGLHFDFHCREDCTELGKTVQAKAIEKLLLKVKPDYVQCDCKGHPGLSSYPTRVGHPGPGFVRDPLKIWRRVTQQHGVALYVHYSGVWDTEVCRRHPEWARVDENGRRDPNNISVFGPYLEAFLLPQLKELCDVYKVDGVWIDGECWATCPDYGRQAVALFRKATGLQTIPKHPGDPHWQEWTDFHREGFRNYLRTYVARMHEHAPHFQVASNWAFSTFMPEPVSAEVDFLSGDFTLQDSVNSARLEGRYLLQQGKPWDLMAWGFSSIFAQPDRSTKPAIQLCQEAAVVLALGGGFQVYNNQRRDAGIQEFQIPVLEKLAGFCRARERICHQARSIPQVALLLSTAAFYRQTGRLFSAWNGELNPLRGVLHALLDNQYHVDLVSEHHLRDRLAEYPVLVIPEWSFLEPDFIQQVVSYASSGGRVLLLGPDTVALFAATLKIQPEPAPTERTVWLECDGLLVGVHGLVRLHQAPSGEPIGWLREKHDEQSARHAAATRHRCGQGEFIAFPIAAGLHYKERCTSGLRKFVKTLMDAAFPVPALRVHGSNSVDVSWMNQRGRRVAHLVNTSGPHANLRVYTFDEVPAVGPLTVEIPCAAKPKAIRLHPGNRTAPFAWKKNTAVVTVPKLDLHIALELIE